MKVVQEIAQSADGEALVSEEIPLAPGATDDARVAYAGFASDKLPPADVLVGRAVRTLRKTR